MWMARSWLVLSFLLLSACGDTADTDDSSKLRAFLETGTPPTAAEAELLNAAFARQAVRASGYRQAQTDASQADAWSPVTTSRDVDEQASDVSAWLDAGDINRDGLFAPCRQNGCFASAPVAEQRSVLEPWHRTGDLEWLAARLSGAAFRLLGSEGTVLWVSELEGGMVIHPEHRIVEINPRLLAVLDAQAQSAEPALPEIETKAELAPDLRETGGWNPPSPPARTHTPPPGYNNDDSSDCDCDCGDFIEVKCALTARPSGSGRIDWTASFFAFAAVALVLRRRMRFSRPNGKSPFRRLPALFLALALSFVASRTEAQPADAAQLEAAAKAYQSAGRLAEAYATLGELLRDEAQLKPAERERIRRQAESLEPRLAFLNLQLTPAEAGILIDGQPAVVDPRSKQVVVLPGAHLVLARANGFADAEELVKAEAGSRNTVVTLVLVPNTATLDVRAPSPDMYIAVDGVGVGRGQFRGPLHPGPHTVQIYREGHPSQDFRITAVAGQVIELPPPAPPVVVASGKAPPPKRVHKYHRGPYVVGQIGFAFLTAKPDGFRYDIELDEETNRPRENPGVSSMFAVVAGMRITRGFGFGGMLMYGRGGGEGTVSQIELSSGGGTLTHEGPADFTQQFLRLGPHFRFMAGRDGGRFLAGTTIGAVQTWIDLEHVHVVEQGGTLLEAGDVTHDYRGLNPYFGFDLGGEFNISNHFLLGFGLDVLVERTANTSGEPFGGVAQGYVGFSIRAGYHLWKGEGQ